MPTAARPAVVMSLLPRWFESKSFPTQLIIVALVCDPIGFGAGYLLAPAPAPTRPRPLSLSTEPATG